MQLEMIIQSKVNQRRRQWHPTPVLLPGRPHGQRGLVACSPWGRWESDSTVRLHFHFSLSCIGEGNGNPLQYSCLENPRDGGAWWAAVHRVAQSWTRLKRLSSSSSKVNQKKTNTTWYHLYVENKVWQGLRLHASNADYEGFIPGQGTRSQVLCNTPKK